MMKRCFSLFLNRFGIVAFLLTATIWNVQAQDVKKVKGKATIRVEKHMSEEEAKMKALELAKRNALADEFGTEIIEGNTTTISNTQTGRSQASGSVNFQSIAESYVNGEWLGEDKPPRFEKFYKDDYLWIKCKVWGKARRMDRVRTDLTVKTMRCPDLKCENVKFVEGDDFFIYFKAPVKGYVSIYLADQENAMCLLPYMNDDKSFVSVEPDKEYIFFSRDNAPEEEANIVDEYELAAETNLDLNRLYIIFSKNSYDKAAMKTLKAETVYGEEHEGYELPKMLSLADFKKWLLVNRTKDKTMQLNVIDITISKN